MLSMVFIFQQPPEEKLNASLSSVSENFSKQDNIWLHLA
jgi:hypothetical protein